MESIPQRTVAREATLEGVGVHSGERASLTVRPAEPGTGLLFRRTDLPDAPEVPADLDHVVGTELGTTLGKGETKVLTVEHLLAALAARGIDNARLDLSGPEPPIRDGSFQEYLEMLADAGDVEQDEPARVIRVGEPVAVQEDGGESYVATKADGYRIAATIDFEHPAIRRQFGSFDLSTESFAREIAPARTFGFKADAEALRARGMARGSSLENTVVLDEGGVMNDGLRFPDEFLRHKIGDIVGDLKLLGARVRGHIVAERPSHRGNVALARALAEADRKAGGRPILDPDRIMQYLPHRYPMLLVDRIVDFESGKRIVGIKNVTINEPFFQGHYPGHPIMPGVLIVEAMAQVGGLLLMDAVEGPENYVVYFMSLDNVKWRRPVTPGDQIVFELEMLQFRRHVCKMRGVGRVDGNVVAEADLMARIVERRKDEE
ncbi:MAG TPA: bifunctional UDP-3-O-[3-hydroxymyristoyl] N-acetylglucosamine deacetylase/3-hydroxyacyl-ACP dehydratase [Longimicrobiales bacterium]|nr:bifunctional UDP-3-O-[3-hydroxymyristoyl] N-acetylglucosamine deacetylase/3-hydroxyacyl-ACP dehydratase [Longimicrobiales bacterium]